MKKRYGVSKDDYEWLQYNCLVEISDKLTKVLKVMGYNEESHTKTTQVCTNCNSQMIWATLTNKWICIECGNVLTIDEIICTTNTQYCDSIRGGNIKNKCKLKKGHTGNHADGVTYW